MSLGPHSAELGCNLNRELARRLPIRLQDRGVLAQEGQRGHESSMQLPEKLRPGNLARNEYFATTAPGSSFRHGMTAKDVAPGSAVPGALSARVI